MAYSNVVTRPDGSLYCDISIESLGFPSFTNLCSLPIRYNGDKFREMGELFVAYARSTCPVDTGYLRDHNDYSSDAGGIEMWSEAFYSAYQEYGTSRCRAQPWFESSIQSALVDSGIEDDFRATETRYAYVDSELSAIQSASPGTIGACYDLIDRINNLQNELFALGIVVDGLDESLELMESRIEALMQEMIMQAMMNPKEPMSALEEILIALIVGMIVGLIRGLIQGITDGTKGADANPHNPTH